MCCPYSIPSSGQKCLFTTIHPPLNSTLSSNTACISTRRNWKERRMHRLMSSLPAYACHVTRTWSRDTHSTVEESCFSTEVFIRRRRPFITQHPFLTGKKKSSNSSVGMKKLDDIWSQQSACF